MAPRNTGHVHDFAVERLTAGTPGRQAATVGNMRLESGGSREMGSIGPYRASVARMATFGHFAAGTAAARIAAARSGHPRLTQLAFGALALLPDLDAFIPGFTHKGPMSRTHTPMASLMGSAVIAAAARRIGLPLGRSFLAALLALGSQPVLDTGTHGKGLAVFWPFSGRRYFKQVPGLPTWKPEKGWSRAGWRSLRGEVAWTLPLMAMAALPVTRPAPEAGKQLAVPGPQKDRASG